MDLPHKLKIDPHTASLSEIQGEALRLSNVVWDATRANDITTRQLASDSGHLLGRIARLRFPEGDENAEPVDISYLAYAGLVADNPSTKQYYLERILELSGGNYDKTWKSGIKPEESS